MIHFWIKTCLFQSSCEIRRNCRICVLNSTRKQANVWKIRQIFHDIKFILLSWENSEHKCLLAYISTDTIETRSRWSYTMENCESRNVSERLQSVHFAKDRTSSYAWTPRFAAHHTEGVEGGACRARAQTCDEPRLPGCSPEVDLDPCLADSSNPFRNLSYSILQPKAHCAAKHQINTDVSSTFMTHVFFSLYIGQAKHFVVNSVATPWSCE